MSYHLYSFHPEYYHGKTQSRPFLEGWYFRHLKKDGSFSIAVIPGLSKSHNMSEDYCFIQVITAPQA